MFYVKLLRKRALLNMTEIIYIAFTIGNSSSYWK